MINLHGIIYAYMSYPELGELVTKRTSSSLPFCARYRIIDFAISSMMNAGIRDVGIIMQRDYQSLLDHLKSGKPWNLDKRTGGLSLLPPFGLPDSHLGEYKGNMEALLAVKSYIKDIRQEHIVLMRGDIVASIDLNEAMETHLASGAEITAVCTDREITGRRHCFIPGGDGFASELMCERYGLCEGLTSLEVYIISKSCLLELISWCSAGHRLSFHTDALLNHMSRGGKIALYVHDGYVSYIRSARDYYKTSVEMLVSEHRDSLFPPQRPVRTKERADVSTYYGEQARSVNSLIADGCRLEGYVENCILFRGVSVEKGARLKNCIIMQDSAIGADVTMAYVIADKDTEVSRYVTLAGNEDLPLIIPKGRKI